MLRLCSILSTFLLALAIAAPAAAKKNKKSDAASSAQGDASGQSTSDKVSSKLGADSDDRAGSKSSKKSKKKKKEEPKAEEPAKTETPAAEPAKEPTPEPDSWEKPPVEQEKPVGPAPKAIEKPKGDGRNWSAGLILGWSFLTDRRSGGADPYGLGFGIRGGYSFDFKLYVGVFYMYYLGSTETGTTAQTGLNSDISQNYMQFGAEFGYDWWAGPVIVRPSLEIGPALLIGSTNGVTASITRLMFGPGINVTYPMDQWFIGGEGRANIVSSNNGYSSILLAVHGGLRFD
jgi:hypothetical protein